jgi:ribose transport system ATP-binding protein
VNDAAAGGFARLSRSTSPIPAPRLSMQGIGKRFGATQALAEVVLEAHAGETLALIGENGAGKSTLMKVLSGAHAPDAGVMLLDGQPFRPRGPADARRAGVVMVYQELNLAPDLSVEDNIMLGQERSAVGWLQRSLQRQRLREVLGLLGHGELELTRMVGGLSIGSQQIVEIARGLVADAKVMVFDEPTSSLSRRDVEGLFALIGRLEQRGLAVIYISHFLEEIRQVAKRYTVLRDGRTVGSGGLSQMTDEAVVSLMIGRSVDRLFPYVPHAIGEVVLEVKDFSGPDKPRHVDLTLRRGEILGIFGLIGAGRTEFLRLLMGLEQSSQGEVRYRGMVRPANPRQRLRDGWGLLSEDRKGEGLAQSLSLVDNLTLSRLEPYSVGGWLQVGKRRQQAAAWLERLQVKARHPDQVIEELSGGNQQKVAIGRLLHQDASLLLFDEPTRGIDVGTKAEIYRWLGELAGQGRSIIFVSSYLPELLATCDTLAVMSRGRLMAVRPCTEWTETEVLESAIAVAHELDEREG